MLFFLADVGIYPVISLVLSRVFGVDVLEEFPAVTRDAELLTGYLALASEVGRDADVVRLVVLVGTFIDQEMGDEDESGWAERPVSAADQAQDVLEEEL